MKADNLDDVIIQLEALIEKCIADKNKIGYFAVLYHKVTCRVRQGILNNEFDDGTRMEKFDVLFANRYLEALEIWKSKGTPTSSWEVAFRATKSSSYLLLHHLLLGINAHINLDLGISAVEAIKSGELKSLQKDFNAINTIISELSYEIINRISRISPLLSLLGLHANNTNSVFIQFAISNARDGAWVFAEELSQKTNMDYTNYILERDNKIKKLASGIIGANFFLRLSIWIIHLFEWRNPSKIIKELQKQRKSYFKITETTIAVGSRTESETLPKFHPH